jgi:hypothetical protein
MKKTDEKYCNILKKGKKTSRISDYQIEHKKLVHNT